MVEFFSRRFGYEYPWDRYDQVLLREFSGAMETTGAVGFSESFLRGAGDPHDSGPSFGEAYPAWTGEDTIAHELAHHWFGDLVTCRSLASLWLNESFASFAHLLWHGEAHGEDDLTYQRWRYLNRYLDYVRATGTVRPLEFDRYATPGAMYQEETTYLKGALVLHMLRHIVGDADFFRGISLYLEPSRIRGRGVGGPRGRAARGQRAEPAALLRGLDPRRRRPSILRRSATSTCPRGSRSISASGRCTPTCLSRTRSVCRCRSRW